jgi:predicted DNA-binding transcriptional regulator AlpA
MSGTATWMLLATAGDQMASESKLMTVEELAELFRTSVSAIYSRKHRGQIPKEAIFKVGSNSGKGKLLFRRAVIEKHFRLNGGGK